MSETPGREELKASVRADLEGLRLVDELLAERRAAAVEEEQGVVADDRTEGRITGFAGVLLWTSAERFPAMAAFYRDVLGLSPRRDRDGFISFEWGEVRLTLTVHDGVDGRALEPLRMMVNLAVDDIHAMHARLAASGVPILRPPEQEDWGGWICTLEDPDGNVVQLFQLS